MTGSFEVHKRSHSIDGLYRGNIRFRRGDLRSNRAADTTCLISDIQMPGMNGADLQDRLIADGLHTPTIFVTAFADEDIRARVLKAGAYGFLTKPFSDESLIECLDKALLGAKSDPSFVIVARG